MLKRYPSTILAAPVIPWDEHGVFDEIVFRKQVQAFLSRGVNHLYLFGTAGEGYAVTDRLYAQIVAVFAEEMKDPDRCPMIGQINLSLPIMLERIQTAYDLGIRDFQFSLPSWGRLSDKELQLFFHTICNSKPDCRFMHYNLGRAKRILTFEEYLQFAEDLPNFVGAKYTTDDATLIQKFIATPSPLQFFLGETGYAIGSMFGECGLLISLANSNLKRAWEFIEAGKNKDYSKLIEYFNDMMGIIEGLFAVTGEEKIDGAYDKLLVRAIQPQFPLRLLPPYTANIDEQSDRYLAFLQDKYPQWLEKSEE